MYMSPILLESKELKMCKTFFLHLAVFSTFNWISIQAKEKTLNGMNNRDIDNEEVG